MAMAMDKPKGKCAPMGVKNSRIVEITDEDETLVIALFPSSPGRPVSMRNDEEKPLDKF